MVEKALIVSPVLALFNPNLDTVLSADTSSYGLSTVLLQRQENREQQLVAFISKLMSPTERRYAQVEKKALAFTWACEHLINVVCTPLSGLVDLTSIFTIRSSSCFRSGMATHRCLIEQRVEVQVQSGNHTGLSPDLRRERGITHLE